MQQEKKLLEGLKTINSKTGSGNGSIDKHTAKQFTAYLVLVAIAAACLSILFYLGPEITGFVTFSESVIKTETDSFSATRSGEHVIKTDLDSINSIMLSGTVTGKGKAAIFLVGTTRNHLAYYFEGDASEGANFTDMCYDTCHVEGLGKENKLWFELEGTNVSIDKIKYMYSRIIDFDLQPRKISIDYNKDPASVIELRLTNKELTNYSVLLYIDGPLSTSFSWQGSLVHMTSGNPEKVISITAKLPSNLPKGEYVHKLTARYVPPDTYDFIGESPVAESFITVYSG